MVLTQLFCFVADIALVTWIGQQIFYHRVNTIATIIPPTIIIITTVPRVPLPIAVRFQPAKLPSVYCVYPPKERDCRYSCTGDTEF